MGCIESHPISSQEDEVLDEFLKKYLRKSHDSDWVPMDAIMLALYAYVEYENAKKHENVTLRSFDIHGKDLLRKLLKSKYSYNSFGTFQCSVVIGVQLSWPAGSPSHH